MNFYIALFTKIYLLKIRSSLLEAHRFVDCHRSGNMWWWIYELHPQALDCWMLHWISSSLVGRPTWRSPSWEASESICKCIPKNLLKIQYHYEAGLWFLRLNKSLLARYWPCPCWLSMLDNKSMPNFYA